MGAADLKGYTLLPRHATDEQRATISVLVSNVKGFTKRAYCQPDGAFTVYGLEEGEYMIDVAVIGWTFPQYNLLVDPKFHDGVRVRPLNSRVPLEPTVILAPMSEAQYFAKKKPIDIRSYLFSPMGLVMGAARILYHCVTQSFHGSLLFPWNPPSKFKALYAVFSLFVLAVLPSMKVDPEEMAKVQEEMKDSPFSFLVGGQPQQPPSSTSGSAAITAAGTGATASTASVPKRGGKRR